MQHWYQEDKGLIEETDVGSFQPLEAEGQSFQTREGRWREDRVSKATTSTNKQHQTQGEELLERAKLHHLANGAPKEKFKNDSDLLWSSQSQLPPGIFLTLPGVPHLYPTHPQNLFLPLHWSPCYFHPPPEMVEAPILPCWWREGSGRSCALSESALPFQVHPVGWACC